MGLDTSALPYIGGRLSAEDLAAFEKANIGLCSGIYSGDGSDGSFRGKVYDSLVWDITGESLYQEWIPTEKVSEMYEKLKSCTLDNFPDKEWDIENLTKFFKVCVERHLGLAGWW